MSGSAVFKAWDIQKAPVLNRSELEQIVAPGLFAFKGCEKMGQGYTIKDVQFY